MHESRVSGTLLVQFASLRMEERISSYACVVSVCVSVCSVYVLSIIAMCRHCLCIIYTDVSMCDVRIVCGYN